MNHQINFIIKITPLKMKKLYKYIKEVSKTIKIS